MSVNFIYLYINYVAFLLSFRLLIQFLLVCYGLVCKACSDWCIVARKSIVATSYKSLILT